MGAKIMTDLQDFLAAIEARKAALCLTDTTAEIEAVRNAGGQRTPEKRALLRRALEQAEEARIVSGATSRF
jgi:uncharacterized membrane protein